MNTGMRRNRKAINQINVVPYIDVMLVLLVIFMVTAPLVNPGEIELPSVGSRLTAPAQPLEVTLRIDHSLWLRDQQAGGPAIQLSRDELLARIRAKQARAPDQPVVIAADRATRYEDVLGVLDLLQRGGAKRVGLLARPPGA
jgi:biopolymer transport protein TolR